MDTIDIIRTNIRYLLKKNGITQSLLAERLGVQNNYISDILNGKKGNEMKIPFAEKIAAIFNVSLQELISSQNTNTSYKDHNLKNIQEWLELMWNKGIEDERIYIRKHFERSFPEYKEWVEKEMLLNAKTRNQPKIIHLRDYL